MNYRYNIYVSIINDKNKKKLLHTIPTYDLRDQPLRILICVSILSVVIMTFIQAFNDEFLTVIVICDFDCFSDSVSCTVL